MTLYIVSTPIGNLADITLRALEVLKEADTILCEDTRVTGKLLKHYEIKKPLLSYHANSKLSRSDKIISMLEEGQTLALVSDAGTPTVSDPGVQLVQMLKQQLPEAKIVPIPGASALLAALSVSGMKGPSFTFLGFLPHKKGRETLFSEVSESKRTVVFYESPHRIEKTLNSLTEHLSEEREVVVARELTKMYEQIVSGTPIEVKQYFTENPDKIRGEFVVIVSEK